uniref:Nuclear transcription factor Y subunit B-6 n=1 Tax=Cajanus cajan TaxID=3821 RepID=A0A151U2F1_CAJCA|nr:Nuclear transcription factor Y subunit B-6 [Cajanus cajan]
MIIDKSWCVLDSKGEGNSSNGEEQKQENRYLPIACVHRLIRKVLPKNTKVSDESKEKIMECVTEFISFITVEANHKCKEEQRKTITAEDLIHAMDKLGFEPYAKLLLFYLHRYRQHHQANQVPHRAPLSLPALPTIANYAHAVLPPPPQPFLPFPNPTMDAFYGDASINIGANINVNYDNAAYFNAHNFFGGN